MVFSKNFAALGGVESLDFLMKMRVLKVGFGFGLKSGELGVIRQSEL
jgi:hypothetical protein